MRSVSIMLRFLLPVLLITIVLLVSIPSPADAQDARSATITRFDYEFERLGIRFFVDLGIENMANQEAQVLLWFLDSGDNFLGNSGWGDDYEDSQGNLMAREVIEPCCDTTEYSRANGHTVSIFVPYSEFPSVDYNYSYDTYLLVRAKSDNAELGYKWLDDTLTVLGEEAPLGYQVWLSIRSITANDLQEDGFLEDDEDELMLTYTLAEVTPDGYAGSVDMYAWVNTLTEGQQRDDSEFQWLYVDVAATSDVIVWLELVEVDDYSAAQEYVGAVNTVLGTLSLVTTPFKLAPPYAAGITLAAFVSGVADITVNLIALLDPNDPMGSPQDVLAPNNLRGIAALDDAWYGSYEFYSDQHNYDLEYSIFVLPYYRQRPAE